MRNIGSVYIIDKFSDIPSTFQKKILLDFYILYRDAIFRNYSNLQTHQDIQTRTRIESLFLDSTKKQSTYFYEESTKLLKLLENKTWSKFAELCSTLKGHMRKMSTNLFNYCAFAALDTVEEWKKPELQTKCAFIHKNGRLEGFVHYRIEEGQVVENKIKDNNKLSELKGKRILYISQLGVRAPNKGTGKLLMNTVLSTHIPSGTNASSKEAIDFVHILFRNFNESACILYTKLGFKKGNDEIAEYYGYPADKYSSYVMQVNGFKTQSLTNTNSM